MDSRQTRSNVNVNLEISLHYLPFITSNEGKSQFTMPRSEFVVMRVSWALRLKWRFMKCVSLAHFLLYNVLRSLFNGYFDEFSMSIIMSEWLREEIAYVNLTLSNSIFKELEFQNYWLLLWNVLDFNNCC